MERVSLPTDKEIKKGVEDVGLEQRYNQKAAIGSRVKHSELFDQVLIVLLLRLRV